MSAVIKDGLTHYEWLSDDPPRFHVRGWVGHYGMKTLGAAFVLIWMFYGVVPALAVLVAMFVGIDKGYDAGWNAATDSCMEYPDHDGRSGA